MKDLKSLLRPALMSFALLTLITGIGYPLLITAIAQLVFPHQAKGSLVEQNGNLVGSRLIGQAWSNPKYFWGRPSATASVPYNAMASGGSNLGPSNPQLVERVRARINALRTANPDAQDPVPMDLVTSSASGLDPEITPEAALWQVARVAKARGLSKTEITMLVQAHTHSPTFGLLGEPRVNVMDLNLALDRLAGH